jgi:hypothetical protein
MLVDSVARPPVDDVMARAGGWDEGDARAVRDAIVRANHSVL